MMALVDRNPIAGHQAEGDSLRDRITPAGSPLAT